MNAASSLFHSFDRVAAAACVLAGLALAATAPCTMAQSQSGFTYNGMDYISYAQSEYLETPQGPDSAAALRTAGANYTAVMATWYVQTATSTTIAPDSSSPSDAAVAAAIQNLQAQGIAVSLKPHVDSLDGVWRGDFAPPSGDTQAEQTAWYQAWFSSYESFILHFAQIAAENNVGMMVIGTEYTKLTGSNCGGVSCETYWLQYVIHPLRQNYPNLTLAYAANATSAGDEFTSVSFWKDIDIIGVDGYFPLTNHADPTVQQLVNAWTNAADNVNGFEPLTALEYVQSEYNKPLIFTEIGYLSAAGTNEAPYNYTTSAAYDPTEQQDCYEAFFEVFSQQTSWMKGVFWWDWTVSPPGSGDTGYSPQDKPAGDTTLPAWYGSTTPGFTLAPGFQTLTLGQGLSTADTISVTPLGGFSGNVTLAASGLPSGVSASFSINPTTGMSVMTLTATSGAAIAGPVPVTVTGTSGNLTASTTVALTVQAAKTQSITFANPGDQTVGTQLALSATASSGLPVSFAASSNPAGVCTVTGSTASLSSTVTGTCTITATQPGNGIYAAATPVSQTFNVSSLGTVPVPANAYVLVSQVNWLAALSGYVQTSNNSTGGSFAVNSAGEIAVADTKNLYLINAQTGTMTTLGAWSGASAVAIDANNNIYVGTLYGSPEAVVELPYVGGSSNGGYAAFTTPTAGLAACTASSKTECTVTAAGAIFPDALQFDTKGDLFWINSSVGTSGGNGIWECSAACLGGTGSPVQLYEEPTASPAPSSSSGQLLAGSLAVDSAGNLFFTDSSTYVNTANYQYTNFYSNLNELPVSTGTGYEGKTTGYSASPQVLYTITDATPGAYDNDLDGVAILRDSVNGDTVYFADQSDGVFAFPDTSTGIPIANGQPTALYMVSTQGAKTMTIDGQGNLYVAASSSAINSSGADSVAQLTINSVTAPNSAVGTAVSPSAKLNPVTTVLNDASCTASPAPAVSFTAESSTTATATVSTTGSCASTLSGGAAFATGVSFTPSQAGSDSVSLLGTDQLGNTGTVTVNGVGAGFTLSPASQTLSVAQGGSSTDTITVSDIAGFAGSVQLAVTSTLPSGVTASFGTNPASSSSVLTLTASSAATAGGPVTVTITGTSGALTATATIALTVTEPPSYTLSATTSSLSVTQGSTATDSITVTPANGFNSGVTLAASGLPTGVTASFSPNPTTSGSSVLTLTASGSATTGGPVTVTITGTSGTLSETTTVAVTVNAAPTFSLAAQSPSLSVTQGASNTDTITITPANGFSGNVSLSASGLPAGVTASFSPNPATTSSSVLTLTASASATAGGPVTVTVTGTSGSLTESTTVALTVQALPPSFTIAASESTLSIAQGASDSTETITITPANGFTGGVNLTASGLPSGVTASFSPNPTATSSSTLTLTASSSATLGGPVTITITGSSSTLSATATLALTVTAAPTFTIGGSGGSTTITVTPGATTGNTATLSISGANGFSGTVNLSCQVTTAITNPSDLPTCSLTPQSVSVSGSTASTSTLTVFTTAPTTAVNKGKPSLWTSAGGTALALLLLFAVPRRRNWLALFGLLTLFISLGALGCGGGSSGGGGGTSNSGTTPGTYTITVTGTSSAGSGTAGTFTLTVQ